MNKKGTLYTTTSGYDILIRNVPHLVLERSASDIPAPEVPTFWNESAKEFQENPNDPAYIDAIIEFSSKREQAMLDAMISFGVVTDAEKPNKKELVAELKEMDRAVDGKLLVGYDLTSDRHLDILWKKFYVLGAAVDLAALQKYAMVQWEAVRDALKSFRTPEEGSQG